MSFKFSIIIPTQAKHRLHQKLIASIDLNNDLVHEVLLVSPTKLSEDSFSSKKIKNLVLKDHSANKARNHGWQHASSPWVYFMDDDTSFSHSKHWDKLIQHLKQQQPIIFGGGYLSPKTAKSSTKTYNQLCNLWLQRHDFRFLLGGNLGINKDQWPQNKPPFAENLQHGGEETLSQEAWPETLREQVYFHQDLSVVHSPVMDIKDLWKKAWIQGRHLNYNRHQSSLQKWTRSLSYCQNQKLSLKELIVLSTYFLIGRLSFYWTSFKRRLIPNHS